MTCSRPIARRLLQSVNERTILKFKKRYFVDDLNVDKSDPIQLHLVYLQSRDAILTGEYPVQLEEAVQFASIQLQVEVGNYDPAVHNDKWFRRPEFLPAAHIKKAAWKVRGETCHEVTAHLTGIVATHNRTSSSCGRSGPT